MKKIEFSLVIPCYNEEKNLFLLYKKIQNLLLINSYEIILVNNGSTDSSFKILSELEKKHSNLIVLNLKKNKGYGNGIVSGLNIAKGDFMGWTHADIQTDPNDCLKVKDIIQKKKNEYFIKVFSLGDSFGI